jgi:hypothetical protein
MQEFNAIMKILRLSMLLAVLAVGVIAVFLVSQFQITDEQPATQETVKEVIENKTTQKETAQLQDDLVPVTFRLRAPPGAEQVKIIFPVWGVCCHFRFKDEGFMMEKKGGFFEATLKLPENGIIRYAYVSEDPSYDGFNIIPEDEPMSRRVHVKENLTVTDDYMPWLKNKKRFISLSGRIHDSNNNPILDVLVLVDGLIEWERGDGTYDVKVMPGRHQIIFWKRDGSYKTYSRIINVTEDTQLDVVLEKAKPVKVKINADANLPLFHKLRMYSNSDQTGASGDEEAQRMIEFEKSVELNLYEGQYFEYVYTIGNIFYGNEHDGEDHPVIRHFTAKDGLVVNDTISYLGHEDDILLNVEAKIADPYDTVGVVVDGMVGRSIYLHKKGNNEWTLKALPAGDIGKKYRYYRGEADSEYEKRKDRILKSNNNDFIEAWEFQSRPLPPQSFEVPEIKNRFDILLGFPDLYSPEIDAVIEAQIERVAEKGHHGIVLTQVWGLSNYPKEPTIKRALSISFYDLKRLAKHAKEQGLKIALYPTLIGTAIASGQGDVMIPGPKGGFSQEWWEKHMEELERFNIYNAKTAEAAGIDYLIVQPASSSYPTDEYNPSDYADYNQRMKEIIKKMRKYYSGALLAEVQGEEGKHPLDYWMDADIVSARVNPPDYWDAIDYTTSQEEADRIIAEEIDKLRWASEVSGKPFIIQQFTPGPLEGFIDNPTREQVENHWERQRKIHSALFKAINERPWIKGVWVSPYNFNDDIERIHVNVRGKPTDELIAAWAREISQKE